MIPVAYLTGDKKHLIFADSEIIKQHGFAGMFPLYSEKEILKHLSSLNQWQPIDTAPINKPIIVISDNTVQHIIVSFNGEYWCDCSSFEMLDDFHPTHWHAVPE